MLAALVTQAPARSSTWQSVKAVTRSWRLLSVALLSFSSGLPLGLVWIALPAWMAREGVDIRVIGLFTLAQAPWSFKFLWSPLMDRFPPPFLGRKRGWVLLSQVALAALGLALASVSNRPGAVWVIGALALAMAFASASQDIAYDAYAVEVLRPEEHGLAVGARTALYRAAMWVSGGVAITLAAQVSWAVVNALLALAFLPLVLVTVRAPEPAELPAPPRTLREAAWGPFASFLAQDRALQILAFVVLFKLSDNVTQALLRPFFVQVGFGDVDVGVVSMGLGTGGVLVGTFAGGILAQARGLGQALWISGLLQILSNLGYALLAEVGPSRPVLYAAQTFEYAMSGLGNGAFGVLLLRLTEKRFSATQYALLSSLFSLPRAFVGPPAGLLVDAIGWRDFFVATVLAGVPGLWMLSRFVPWGVREPRFQVAAPNPRARLSNRAVALRAALAAAVAGAATLCSLAALEAVRSFRAGRGFPFRKDLRALLAPDTGGEWTTTVGALLTALFVGLAVAAALKARGAAPLGPSAPE
jgi:PAT family beta-lactamase induction signal transducer AmpG